MRRIDSARSASSVALAPQVGDGVAVGEQVGDVVEPEPELPVGEDLAQPRDVVVGVRAVAAAAAAGRAEQADRVVVVQGAHADPGHPGQVAHGVRHKPIEPHVTSGHTLTGMNGIEVRREDGELVGFVAAHGDRWQARTVFGAPLATADDSDEAEEVLLGTGLAVLAERWWLHRDGEWLPVAVLEAGPGRVTVQVGRFPEPLDRPVTLTGEAAAGLRRQPA